MTLAGRSTLPYGLLMSTVSPFLMPRASASTVDMKHSCGKASRRLVTGSCNRKRAPARKEWGVHESSGNSSVCVPMPCSGSPICHLPMGGVVE